MKPTVMIVGLGSLGGVLLELAARDPDIGKLVVASRDRRRGEARCNLARVGAFAQGAAPDVQFAPLDLDDPDRAAEVFARHAPDLIVSTASLQTWWLTELLPPDARQRLGRAPFGAWLPVHLALAIKFMTAVRAAGLRCPSVVASFPDVVNVVLGRLGLAPTCGLGNLDEIVPKVRHLAAGRLRAPPTAVRALLVAHHALEPFVFGGSISPDDPRIPPYWLRIEHDGRDVTGEVAAARLLFEDYRLPAGPAWHFLTAGSALRLIRALLGDREELVHVPAPAGLPGGYPAAASRGSIRLLDLPGLSLEQAIAINERSARCDGIERIESDGSVRFTSQASDALQELLGYNGGPLRPSECDARASELIARFREYAARHGVDLAVAEGAARVML